MKPEKEKNSSKSKRRRTKEVCQYCKKGTIDAQSCWTCDCRTPKMIVDPGFFGNQGLF